MQHLIHVSHKKFVFQWIYEKFKELILEEEIFKQQMNPEALDKAEKEQQKQK